MNMLLERIWAYIIAFLKMVQNRFKADKVAHFTMGYVLFDLSQKILLNDCDRKLIPTLIGFIVVILIGWLKELWDKYSKHSYFDVWDLVATVLGGLACYLIY